VCSTVQWAAVLEPLSFLLLYIPICIMLPAFCFECDELNQRVSCDETVECHVLVVLG